MTESLQLGTGALATVQVARKPILSADMDHSLVGYELIFSDTGGLFSAFADADEQKAASEVVSHSVLTLGVDAVVGDALAFMRFPKAQLVDATPMLLPPGQSVIEVGRDTWATGDQEAIAKVLTQYIDAGYRIALSDFFWTTNSEPLLALADYVTLDLALKDHAQITSLLEVVRQYRARTIATGVDTATERDRVVAAGVDYVQGFFFSAPNIVEGRELPGFKLAYLQLLRKAYEPQVDFAELAKIIKTDVGLSFKLLRYVNSAHFGLRGRIESLEKALVMLGTDNVRRWVSVATVSGLSAPGPVELAILCATRGRFCESLGVKLGMATPHECFSVGMFSLLDVMLGKSLDDALADVAMADEVMGALRGEDGALADLLRVVVAYERGRWDDVTRLAQQRGWPEPELIGHYIDAIEWARDFFGPTAATP